MYTPHIPVRENRVRAAPPPCSHGRISGPKARLSKMRSSLADKNEDIETAIERVSRQRIALREGYIAPYNGPEDSEYQLRYILSCLGLRTSGSKPELIDRIETHGVQRGELIYDLVNLGDRITVSHLDSCPDYLLKVYLKKHNLPILTTKADLIAMVREHMVTNSQEKLVPFIVPEDKKVISDTIHTLDHGGTISKEAIELMELHGYQYDTFFRTFFHTVTHEKLLGKKSIWETINFALYPSLLGENTRLITH